MTLILVPYAVFPAMTGHGMAIAQTNLGPGAMLPPHYHTCADDMVIAMSGNTTTWRQVSVSDIDIR